MNYEQYFGCQLVDDTLAAMKPQQPFKARSIYASDIAHPCMAYQIYKFTHGDKIDPTPPEKVLMFAQGNQIEDVAQRHLTMGGWKIITKEERFEWDNGGRLKTPMAGRIDFRIGRGDDHRDRGFPIDIKGLAPYTVEKLVPEEGIDQFINAREMWLRKYPGQILLYCFMGNWPVGALHIYNKANYGNQKTIWFRLDDHLEYVETLLKRAEEINACLEAGEPGEPLQEWDDIWCKWCPYVQFCLPNRDFGPGAEFIEDDHLAKDIARLLELEATGKEYKKLDDSLKTLFKPSDGTSKSLHRGEGTQFVNMKYAVVSRAIAKKGSDEPAWRIKFSEIGEEK